MFKIEKGIAPPAPKQRYPWEKMNISDSFFLPESSQRSDAVSSALKYRKIDPNFRVKSRMVKEGRKTGYRIWRVA